MGIGMIGIAACLGLAALGSALGVGTSGMSAIGAWKKCYIQHWILWLRFEVNW